MGGTGNLVSGVPAAEDGVETSVFYQSVMTWKNLQVIEGYLHITFFPIYTSFLSYCILFKICRI